MSSRIQPITLNPGVTNASARIMSLLKNPPVSGKPDRFRHAISIASVTIIHPFWLRSPLTLRRSSCPAKPCITAPQHRNSVALKNAWVKT